MGLNYEDLNLDDLNEEEFEDHDDSDFDEEIRRFYPYDEEIEYDDFSDIEVKEEE